MRIAIIGRTEILYKTALRLRKKGQEIALIITAKESPEYTKTSADFHALADKWGIPFIHTAQIEDALPIIVAAQCNIGVSLNYSGVVPQSVIDCVPLGILNAHGGDLPRYRGNACQAWAILNGEPQIGLCVHKMIGGELDSGDIIAREYYPLTIDTKITSVLEWMGNRIPELFEYSLKKLSEDPQYILERQSKDSSRALRGYPRKPEDGRICWRRSATDILRLVNACNKPYAGAFCEFDGQKIIIWDAALAEEETFLAVPGQITKIGNQFVEVATGLGKLKVNVIELNGREISPDQIIRSIRKRFS